MTIRRRLLIEFCVSFVLGLAACLGVSAYLAATSNATRVAATNDTKKDPVIHIVAYAGMGFSAALVETFGREDAFRNEGIYVSDRKGAGAGMEWAMDALRDRSVTMAGAFGWPVLFCRWTYVAEPVEAAGVRGVHAWGPVRTFEVELPPPPPGRAGAGGAGAFMGWAAPQVPKITLRNVPSNMLPTAIGHVDIGSLFVSASVFIVACWIVIHMLIELVKLILGLGKTAAE